MRNFNKQTKWRLPASVRLGHLSIAQHPPGDVRMGSGRDLRPATGPSMVLILRPIRVQHVLLIRLRIPGIILIIIIITRGLQSTTGPCPLHLVLQSAFSISPYTVDHNYCHPVASSSSIRGRLESAGVLGPAEAADSATGDRQTLHWLPTRQRMTTRQGLPTRQNVMTRQLPTRQGGGRPSRTEGSSSDDSSKVPDCSSAMTWFRDCFWGWECDIAVITQTY